MFWFLKPALLWALPLALAPVVLHLLFLRAARRVPFSDLSLLRLAFRHALPSSRLRQWLVLLARCLILACLVLAFAGPVVHSGLSGWAGSGEPVSLAVLLDASYSMAARSEGSTRLAAAAGAGARVLELLGPRDKVAALVFSDRIEGRLDWTGDRAAAAAYLRKQVPGGRGTDLPAALGEAYDLLREAPTRLKAVLVLSDNARHAWRGTEPARFGAGIQAYDPSAALLGLRWEDPVENGAVSSVEPAFDPMEGPSLSVWTSLSARTGAPAPRRDWDLDLWQASRRTAQKSVAVGKDAPPASFRLAGPEPSLWGKVELRKDALPEDDAFYYSLWVQPRPRVLAVTGGPRTMEMGRGGYFLAKLFAHSKGSLLPYAVDIADSGRAKELSLQDYKAVMLLDFRSVPAELGRRLEAFVRSGGGLWLVLSRAAEPDAYAALGRLLPCRPGDWSERRGAAGILPDEAGAAEAANPGFSWRDFELQRVAVRRSAALDMSAGSRVWLRDPAGAPLLASGAFGSGKVLVWAASLDLDSTNLALKPVFAAWLDLGLGHLTGYRDKREWRAVKVGGRITRSWGPDEPAPQAVRIRGPGGRSATVQVAGRRASYEAPEPGLYFIEGAGRGAGPEVFAVNLDRTGGESDLREAPEAPWRPLRRGSLKEDLLSALYGREARPWLLALAAALMLAEMLLAAPAPQRPGQAGGEPRLDGVKLREVRL